MISGVNLDEATWLSWSPNVFMEGRAVTRLTDKMLMNRGNTVSIGGYYTKWPQGSKEAILCDIGCACWVSLRGSSRAGPVVDKVPMMRRRYSACFKKATDELYPNTKVGTPGNPGLASEIGYWDPNNPANTADGGKSPVLGISREAPWYGGDWFDIRGSRWMDATWVDAAGKPTDMWDLKFGDDLRNNDAKNKAYEDIAAKNHAIYHGEFLIPKDCDNCDDAEEQWQTEKNPIRILKDELARGMRGPIGTPPGIGGVPPIAEPPIFVPP